MCVCGAIALRDANLLLLPHHEVFSVQVLKSAEPGGFGVFGFLEHLRKLGHGHEWEILPAHGKKVIILPLIFVRKPQGIYERIQLIHLTPVHSMCLIYLHVLKTIAPHSLLECLDSARTAAVAFAFRVYVYVNRILGGAY